MQDKSLMSEFNQLREAIESTDKKIERLLTWAEGDHALGTPSIKTQIDGNREEIEEVKKKVYTNREMITKLDVRASLYGGGTGTAIVIGHEIIKAVIS